MEPCQLYSNLIDRLPQGLIVWQLKNLEDASTFELVAANPVARQILGLPLETSSTFSVQIDLPIDPFPSFLKMESPEVYASIVRSQQARDLGEVRYRNEQHVEKVFFLRAFPLPPQQFGITFEDITDCKQTEEALRESERKLLFHLKQAPLAIIEWDLNFRVVEWNATAERIFGYARNEALGHHASELILPENPQMDMQLIWHTLLKRKTSIKSINRNITGDGRTIYCEWHSAPLIDEEGKVISIISLVQDVTDRVHTEVELRQFTARLKQSNQALQDFAAIASHDLQEPLRKIHAFGDRLKTKFAPLLPEEGQDYINRMQRAVQRMQTLINSLLTFSRVTTKAQPFTSVNLAEVVRDVLSDLEISIQQSQAQIEVAALPTLEADPIQMRQLLQNLISNALKFHKPNLPPQIKIQTQIISVPPSSSLPDRFYSGSSHAGNSSSLFSHPFSQRLFCQLELTDNGIGFDERQSDRIFSLFQRLHGRNEYEGTGLGLAICKRIVERHNGQITVSSYPGEGATFIITLPMQQP